MLSMTSKATWLALLLISLVGCATVEKMDSFENPMSVIEEGKSIYLLSGNLRNDFKPKYQPKLSSITVERMEDNESIVFTIPETTYESFKGMLMDDLYMAGFYNKSENPKIGHSFLAHISLKPGEYILRGISSGSTAFLTKGTFGTPIHETIEVSVPGVYYLGRVNGVVRKRSGNEFKAGSSIPLIDQAVVGATGGTFEVEILDNWEEDESLFLKQFPVLQGMEISKKILPPFDRDRAQEYWEK